MNLVNAAITKLGGNAYVTTDVVEEAARFPCANWRAAELPLLRTKSILGANVPPAFHGKIRFASSAQGCIRQADVIVLATPWQEFIGIPCQQWARHSSPRTVVDCWRVLKHLDGCSGIQYLGLGTGEEPPLAPPLSSNSQLGGRFVLC